MTKKTFTILTILVILIGLFILGFFLYRNAKQQNGGAPVTLKDLFPFGKGDGLPGPGGQTTGGQTSGGQQVPGPNGPVPRLRKISEEPIIGYTTLKKEVPVDPNSIPAPRQEEITTSYAFTEPLKVNDSGEAVTELQKFLNKCPATQIAGTGAGSPGKEGTVYGPSTEKAVKAFQELFANDILKPQNLEIGTGVVDELTIKKIQTGFICTFPPAEVPKTVVRDIVRYVARGTSNIFDAFADTLVATRLSDTTIPRVTEAVFAEQGKSVFLRSLEADNQTINTLLGRITEPVVGGDALPELSVFSMPKNISDLTVSPDGRQIFFMLPSGSVMNGFTSDLDGRNQKKVFSSQFMGWLSQWATSTKIVLTVKATGYATGYAFTTDITKGDFTKLSGPISALTTLMSPDGNYLLISRNTISGPDLALQNTTTKQIRSLGLSTLPEKCVWSNNSLTIYCAVPNAIPAGRVYPDDWYQGEVLFSDSFWRIDVGGTYDNEQLFSPLLEGGESTDGVRLQLDQSNRYLYFMNKTTGIGWQYDLVPIVENVI